MDTKRVYHVVTLSDLEKTIKYGIRFNAKKTYENKYKDFHHFIDNYKPSNIPEWVNRSSAIFASMNFKPGHLWHSHSAVLSIKIHEDLCWVCNENIANFLYEPLILKDISSFEQAGNFLGRNGKAIVLDYWNTSCSFRKNLLERRDKKAGYDAEVLILHDILPEDIEILYIASDHRFMKVEEWREFYRHNKLTYSNC